MVWRDVLDLSACCKRPRRPGSDREHGYPALQAVDLNLFKTPGTRKPPLTPTRQYDAAPRTPKGGQAAPRTAPRTAGRELVSADGQESVKVRLEHAASASCDFRNAWSLGACKLQHLSIVRHAQPAWGG